MNGKIARISDLTAAGWEVEDIQSDDDHITVLLQRGAQRQRVLLGKQDAWDILYGAAFQVDGRASRGDELTVAR